MPIPKNPATLTRKEARTIAAAIRYAEARIGQYQPSADDANDVSGTDFTEILAKLRRIA